MGVVLDVSLYLDSRMVVRMVWWREMVASMVWWREMAASISQQMVFHSKMGLATVVHFLKEWS